MSNNTKKLELTTRELVTMIAFIELQIEAKVHMIAEFTSQSITVDILTNEAKALKLIQIKLKQSLLNT